MIRSLRFRILLRTSLMSSLILALLGVSIYFAMRHVLMRDFDDSLRADAKLLAGMIEQDGTKVTFEFAPDQMPDFVSPGQHRFFQLWREDGSALGRSPSLVDRSLAPRDVKSGDAGDETLPGGQTGRFVLLRYTLKPEEEDEKPPGPGQSVRILVAARPENVSRTLAELAGLLTLLCAAGVIITEGGLWRMVTQGLRPVNALAGEIGGLKETDLGRHFESTAMPVELIPIVERLNGFLARLQAAFLREKSFTADVAHELRTPLAGLQSTLEVCRSRPREPAEYQAAIDECAAITDRMGSMTEMLLLLARSEAGEVRIDRRPVDLVQLFDSGWQLFEHRANERGLKLTLHMPSRCDIHTDAEKLRIVLLNVLDNAVSYANSAGQIRISLEPGNQGAVAEIANTGSAIDAKDVPHVFDRFWRGEASRSQTTTHSGLGLSLARRLVTLLGGEISITSVAGGEFVVRLVLASSE